MPWYTSLELAGLSKHVLIVTAKGQSDFGTRKFLHNLAQAQPHVSFFYIGDADAFGAEIFFTYLFGSVTECLIENREHCNTLFCLEWIGPFIDSPSAESVDSKCLLKLSERDKGKAYSLLNKAYLANTYLTAMANSEQEARFKALLSRYKKHLIAMVTQERKFEVEALLSPSSSGACTNQISELNHFVIDGLSQLIYD